MKKNFAAARKALVLGDLVIHPIDLKVIRQGKNIKLGKKEFQLLEFLAHNKNRVVNRQAILEYLWDYNAQAITNTLDVTISKLRRKIDGNFAKKMIQTVYGAGYKLCDKI